MWLPVYRSINSVHSIHCQVPLLIIIVSGQYAGRDCRTRLGDQILRREREQGNINFLCSADHVPNWQPYPVGPYSCYVCYHTCIHTGYHADTVIIQYLS